MAFIFQYGSNLSTARLNHPARLQGDARLVGKAVTDDDYEFEFDIWSAGEGGRAASDIVAGHGRKIWGVVYEIPDYLIKRETAKPRKSLDAIEGEGSNYERNPVKLNWANGCPVAEPVITYTGKARKTDIKTNQEYADYILRGLAELAFPADYVAYIKAKILANNPTLRTDLPCGGRPST
jgi:hypothetical protein